MTDSYPRRSAITGRFSFGAPRSFAVAADGERVVFLRSHGPEDPACGLWVLGADGIAREVAVPAIAGEVPPEEAALRERRRESGAGITAFAIDRDARTAVFALNGRLLLADLVAATARELPAAGPVVDPRLAPDGAHIAYVAGGSLRVIAADGTGDRPLLTPDTDTVTWGLADFIAAEELDRYRGHWWSPDSDAILAIRVDDEPVAQWVIADPAHPAEPPRPHRYPAAGTANARLSAAIVTLGGDVAPIHWDHDQLPYVAGVSWNGSGPPLLQLLSRRQDRAVVVAADTSSGAVTVLREQSDDCWVDVVPGVPALDPGGRLLTVEVADDTYRLLADGTPVTPIGWQVRAVDVGDEVMVSGGPDTTQRRQGLVGPTADDFRELPTEAPGGLTSRIRGGGTEVIVTASLAAVGTHAEVRRTGVAPQPVSSLAEAPPLHPTPLLAVVALPTAPVNTAVIYPTGWTPGSARLPVLLDPYGGPHASRVVAAASAHLSSQWFADAGFAVVVIDGRGTPGTPSFERAVRFDLAGPTLADQLDALDALALDHPDLDLDRVGIRGWSFGGYLAALAVLRRPDRVHAAVAGAPPTDWELYDTGYTERYLGLPAENPDAYRRSALLPDAAEPGPLPPLLLIHGLADDNVVAAHTLRLSTALLAAGRPHSVLPLTGVTHMTPQVAVAENLLSLQRDFLLAALSRPVGESL